MTFTVKQHGDGKHLDVGHTYGPVRTEMTEDIGHLRAFWHELGRELDKAENPEQPHHDPTAHGEGLAP